MSNVKIPAIVKEIVPGPTEILREAIIVLAGVLIAAYVLNKFPAAKKYVEDASVTVKDGKGNTLY